MRLGVTVVGDSLDNFVRYVRQADEAGVAAIGSGDSQSLYHEVWSRCTLAGANSEKALVGPWATNPVTRHPSVTAGGAATLAILTGGRAYVGIGPGDSAVYNIGHKPAKLSRLEEYICTVHRLLEEGEAEWDGKLARLDYSHPPVKVAMPASGPKALRLAGKVADMVWVCTGLTPEVVREATLLLAEGAEEGGRTLDDLDIWWVGLLNIRESREVAIEELKFSLASYAHIIFRYTMDGKAVLPELSGAIQRLAEGYQSRFHVQPGGENPNAKLVEDLGLKSYLANRLSITGTLEECLEQFRRLKELGVEQVWSPIRFSNKQPLMNAICNELMLELGKI